MLNWTTGAGTAKYWTSKLLIDTADIDNDVAVITQTTDVGEKYIFSQAFVGKSGRRWILVINKRFATVNVQLSGCIGGTLKLINEASGFGPPIQTMLTSDQVTLAPFSVAVIIMPTQN